MNPDKDDPNNHVPAVSPEDDWDGLDAEQAFDAQLPPRRSDKPKLPKMEVNLTEYKAIDLSRHVSGESSANDDPSKSIVAVNIGGERVVAEKDEFQPGLDIEDMRQLDPAAQGSMKIEKTSRFAAKERDAWGTNQVKSTFRWMLYSAAGVILLIVLTIFLSQYSRKKASKDLRSGMGGETPQVKQEQPSQVELGMLAKIINSKPEAMEMFVTYVHAKSVDDFSNILYLSERNSALVRDHWRPTGAREDWKLTESTVWNALQGDGDLHAELRGMNHDFSKFTAFFRYENSDLKMDWKATTAYSTASFDVLREGKGDGSEIRGWISTSNFYTLQLPDNRFRSFILRSPKKDDSVWVYTEIGSEIDENVMALFQVSPITGEFKSEVRVILHLDRGNQEILPNQWMIKNLKATNWLDQAKP